MLNEKIIKKATGVDIYMPEEDSELEKEKVQFCFDATRPSTGDETVTKEEVNEPKNNVSKLKWGIALIIVTLIILYLNR